MVRILTESDIANLPIKTRNRVNPPRPESLFYDDKCREYKTYDNFYKSKTKRIGGVVPVCKGCVKIRGKKWNSENKKYISTKATKYAKDRRDSGDVDFIVSSKLWIGKTHAKKGGYQPCLTDKEEIIKVYTKTCMICETESNEISLDHCHKTGKFRGFICSKCNLICGRCNDCPEHLKKVISYLDHFIKNKEELVEILKAPDKTTEKEYKKNYIGDIKVINKVFRRMWSSRDAARRYGHKPCDSNIQVLIDCFTDTCELCQSYVGSKIELDHCHETGVFRAWLCRHCNTICGNARDNPDYLRKILAYLEKHQKSTKIEEVAP